jgi:hypothetical protein
LSTRFDIDHILVEGLGKLLIEQLPVLIESKFEEIEARKIKQLIDQRFRDLEMYHLPHETKFPNGIFDVNLNDMKSILAALQQLPFILCGVFNDDGK